VLYRIECYSNDMRRTVKSRVYDNSRREAAALETRRAIVDSAHRLFLEKGYGGTSLTDVAEAAGVSVQTLYAQLGSKRVLLKEVLDVAIAGDHEPVAIRDRPAVAAIEAEPDGVTKLRLLAQMATTIAARYEPVDRMIRSAAAVDPDVDEQLEQAERGRLAGMGEFAQHLHDAGVLRQGLTVEEAGQRIWSLHGALLYRQLHVVLGWSHEHVADFIADLLVAALLPPASARAPRKGAQKSGRKGVGERR
jgi:AcrR family transcriptional regulator